jgi:hypothetical protein
MSKKILLCGDSFGIIDKKYPGLHFSEKIQKKIGDCDFINLSVSGHSNSLIELQVNQGLAATPDAVIVLFTAPNRIEFDREHSQHHKSDVLNANKNDQWQMIKKFNHSSYITSAHCQAPDNPESDNIVKIKKLVDDLEYYKNTEFEYIKQYFIVLSIFNLLTVKKIPFCYNLGGLKHSPGKYLPAVVDLLDKHILKKHFLNNELLLFTDKEINTDLWGSVINFNQGPAFHVADDNIQSSFADECIFKLRLL